MLHFSLNLACWHGTPDNINNECTLHRKTEISLVCAIVYWNEVVSNSLTAGKLNHLAHPVSASALVCAFCSNPYCEPNDCCVRSKHKHFLFRTLQLLIQHRGVVFFSSLAGTLIPEKSWEGSWSMLNKELTWARVPNTNVNSNLLVLPPQQEPSHCNLIWWAGLVVVGSDEDKAKACSTYQS